MNIRFKSKFSGQSATSHTGPANTRYQLNASRRLRRGVRRNRLIVYATCGAGAISRDISSRRYIMAVRPVTLINMIFSSRENIDVFTDLSHSARRVRDCVQQKTVRYHHVHLPCVQHIVHVDLAWILLTHGKLYLSRGLGPLGSGFIKNHVLGDELC